MNSWFCQKHLQGFLSIAHHRNICTDNLTNLGWINVDMSNLSIFSKGLRISSQAVIETATNTNHKVRFGHGNISRERTMHASHTKEEWMTCRNRSLPQKTGHDWNLIAFSKFIQFFWSFWIADTTTCQQNRFLSLRQLFQDFLDLHVVWFYRRLITR